jgi:Ca2+-transporting ATPase
VKQVEDDDEETPLQKRLDELAGMIGKIGVAVAVLDFVALTLKYVITTANNPDASFGAESINIILKYLTFSIIIVVIAVPEGLPLAVAISLAYSVKKMLKDNNLVRHLASCETMGSATSKLHHHLFLMCQ